MKTIRANALWLGWLVVATALIIGFLLPGQEDWHLNIYYDLIAAASAAMIVVGVRVNRPSRARLWYLFAAGQALWALGDFAYGYSYYVLELDEFPSVADGIYLAAYPILIAGLFILIRGRTSGRDRSGFIDACIIATGLGLLSWVFLIQPILDDPALAPWARLISVSYPAADMIMIVMVARLFTSPGARTASYRLLGAALLAVLATDVAYSQLTNLTTYDGGLIDAGWLISYALWAAAALHPSMRSLSEVAPDRAPRIGTGRLVMLAGVSLLAPALLFQQGLTNPDEVAWVAIGVGSVALFLLVLARMAGLIARVQDQASQLAALAHNDALTGVPNRRAWDLELAREMAISRRTGLPLSVAMLDLDNFKRFNDRHGHQAGDRLLTQAAALWGAQLRGQDYLARYGGEEFCVMVTGLAATDAREVLERLLAATPDGQTFSAGVSNWDGVESPESLLARTDGALYHAKRAGRNRVTLAEPSPREGDREAARVTEPRDLESAAAGR